MSYINEKDKVKIGQFIDQRTPDIEISEETKRKFNEIVEVCKKSGLDGFDYIYELFRWDEISELAAYGGFPVRYPHYLFGMEFEHMNQSYKYGYSKIYELVINNDPTYAYLLGSNSDVDNLTVIAHAYAHNDFFKNNFWFSPTNRNMINEMASHGTKIRRYCRKYGRDKVIRFLDLALSIQFLIDPDDVFNESTEYREENYVDEVITEEPRKIGLHEDHEYMDDFINPDAFIEKERDRIKKSFQKKMRQFPESPTKDIIGFLAKNSPRLRNWMKDILFMIREEALYFVPQIKTQICNEGWASYWDEQIMAKQCYAGDDGIIDYARHHAGVMGGKYSRNPYAVGNMLLKYIQMKWDKGRFGPEWDECKDRKKREEWDTHLNKGMEKIFEVRKLYDDRMLVDEFMDQDFCDENEFYIWERNKKGEHVLVSKDVKDIKERMLQGIGMERFPVIRVKNANCLNLGHLHLEHVWTGQTLSQKYALETIKFVSRLWGRPVVLTSFEIHDNYDKRIPMEINDKIFPIAYFTLDGQEAHSGIWDDYRSEFIDDEEEKKDAAAATHP